MAPRPITTNEKCNVCGNNLKVGVFCETCEQYKHYKCEKLKAGTEHPGYVCKACKRQRNNGDENEENIEKQEDRNKQGEEPSDINSVSLDNSNSGMHQFSALNQDPLTELSILREQIQHLETVIINQRDELKTKGTVIDLLTEDLRAANDKMKDPTKTTGNHNLQMCKECKQSTAPWETKRKPWHKPKHENSPNQRDVITLHNKFDVLTPNDSDITKINDLICPQKWNERQRSAPKQHKLLILSDSHGRNVSKKIKEKLGDNYQVTSFVKPNAKIQQVTECVNELSAELSEEDCILILGGTNDINDADMKNTIESLANKVSDLSHKTNIIVSAIPYRYDHPRLCYEIDKANVQLYKTLISSLKNKGKVENVEFSTACLNVKEYSNRKVHFNARGKSIICKRLSQQVTRLAEKETYVSSITIPNNCERNIEDENFP